ncbi:DUF732 domain-containing protein [Mycolicibacterium sp. XJ1819]
MAPARVLSAVVTAVAFAAPTVAFAAPAAADESEYLRKLQPKYEFLSADQLLAAGAAACDAARRGVPGSDAAVSVQHQLGVSGSAASTIVATAVVELGC